MASLEELLRINEEQRKQNEELSRQLALQQQQIDWLKQQLFGRKSEKLREHPELFPLEEDSDSKKSEASSDDAQQAEEADAGASDPNQDNGKKKRRTRSQRLPENLPVKVVKELIPEEVSRAPEEWREIGQEHSDQLEKEPGYFYIRRIVRRKYVRTDHPFAPPVIAPAEPTLIENGFWGAGLLSEILSNKYLYALPLHRQGKLYQRRYGIDLSPNTMGDAVNKVSEQLQLIVDHMARAMIGSGYLQADETSVRYLDPEHPSGSALGYLWTYRSARGEVVFDWRTNREHANVENFLDQYPGTRDVLKIIQSDGYDAYESYIARHPGQQITRVACMAHIRRKFKDSLDQRPQLARWFLRQIARLYGIEEMLREHRAPPELRQRLRQRQSRRIIQLIEKAIDHLLIKSTSILPKSNLGKALRYARGQWKAMRNYLDHGRVEIDNNLIENSIRPTAVGKKNHLFFGSPEAGKRSAIIYSLLLSAEAQGVDPQAYLRDLIERVPTATTSDLDRLTPANWAAEHKEKATAQASAA